MCATPRNLTWLTQLFLPMRGWDLGTRLRSLLNQRGLCMLFCSVVGTFSSKLPQTSWDIIFCTFALYCIGSLGMRLVFSRYTLTHLWTLFLIGAPHTPLHTTGPTHTPPTPPSICWCALRRTHPSQQYVSTSSSQLHSVCHFLTQNVLCWPVTK